MDPVNSDSMKSNISLQKYKKGGSAGSKGVEFQINLLIVLFFNSLRKLKDWRLSTENEAAGKFDDAVLEWPEGTVLVQAKQIEKKKNKINFDALISTNTKNDNFSLPKYFLSYQEIKHRFKSAKNVVICTNASVHQDTLEFLDPVRIDSESMLYCGDDDYSFFKFKKNILPRLSNNVKIYLEKNSRNKNIDQSVITDENLKEFLERVQFYSDYPLESKMENVTEQLLSIANCKQISYSEIYGKVMDWFKRKSGMYLTEFVVGEMFSQIKRDKHWQRLEEHKMSFRENGINFQDGMKMYHFTTERRYLLQDLKIYHTLKTNKSKVLYVGADDGIEERKRAIDAFQLYYYKFLIIIGSTMAEESVINELSDKLRRILDEEPDKKIILVTEANDKLVHQMRVGRSDFVNIAGSVTYEELSADSREKLLKRNVVFQGRDVSLRELLVKQTDDVYKTLNSEIMENLFQGEKIKVGSEVPPLEQHVSHYYISRRFERLMEDEKGAGKARKETIPEDKIFEVNEKLVLIADGPGNGKTTVFSKLALIIKEEYPHLWVFRIELNEYCGILKKFKDTNKETISIIELLHDKDKTRLWNQLEEVTFLMKDRVVLLLDGVDEISPDYTELVFSLIGQCQKQDNFAKVFISTRPHMSEKLEEKFKLRAFSLLPFTTENQTAFLADYWSHSLELPDPDKGRCEQYAEILLKATSRWVESYWRGESHMAAIPLQLRMIGELFKEKTGSETSSDWEGCKEFLCGNEQMPKLPEKINIAKIYKMFIGKKRDIFISKENPSGNTGAERALSDQFQQCLYYHRSLALEKILNASECQLFSHYQKEDENMEESVLKIGIVQMSENEPQFVHRTFAEYFVGESLLMELQLQIRNQNKKFQKFFFDKILLDGQFEVVRAFFDNFLEDVVDSLPSDIFKTYQSLVYDVDFRASSDLIHRLAGEGCVAILRLLFKCMNHQHFISNIGIKITKYFQFKILPKKYDNTLSLLKSLLQNGGIDIRDSDNRTPLYYGAQRGHLEMAKFLVAQGADVNSTDLDDSPLNVAVDGNHLDVVKFLVEKGADIKLMGHEIIFKSIIENHVNVTAYLLDKILEVQRLEVKDSIIPYAAAYLGRMDLLKDLEGKGLDVNSKIENGESLIFSAARGGQADTIKYLVRQGVDINSRDEEGNTALHLAAEKSTLLSATKTLVESGIDVNLRNSKGRTALWTAASRNQLESVKFLVQHGSDVNVTNDDGNTVLHEARGDSHRYLVECGANVHIRNKYGRSPLHRAVVISEFDTVRCLTQCGADVNARDNQENTVLHLAATSRWHWRQKIECLVELGGEINACNEDGRTPLHMASILGNLDAVECLVQHGVDVDLRDKKTRTALHAAALNGQWRVVQFLVERDAGIEIDEKSRKRISSLASEDIRSRQPFHEAAKRGDLDMVKLFGELGVDVNVTDWLGHTPLHYAVSSCRMDVVEYFLERGSNFDIADDGGYTILYYAIRGGRWDMVEFCRDRGMDVNAKDTRGRTALHYAVQAGRWKMAEIFLKRGMDVNSKDDDGCTPIHSAASRCNLKFVNRLLQRGADASIRDKRGRTVLHYAVWNRWLDVTEYFLRLGADHNIKDTEGRTALHLAAQEGNRYMVEFLLKFTSDVNVRDDRGRTPLHFAVLSEDEDIVETIVELGGDVNAADVDGYRPLHLAASLVGDWPYPSWPVAKFLVQHGADVHRRTSEGDTAAALAEKSGNHHLLNLLESRTTEEAASLAGQS